MAHINLIPLNPTGGFGGGPSGRANVQNFVNVLEREFRLSATPRMRRGIDIDAGCGQLTTSVKKKEDALNNMLTVPENGAMPMVGVYEDDEGEQSDTEAEIVGEPEAEGQDLKHGSVVDFSIDNGFINLDDEDMFDDFNDPTFEDEFELAEADRLLALIQGTTLQQIAPSAPDSPPTEIEDSLSADDSTEPEVKRTKITDEDAIRTAKRRRKKLVKQLKAIERLKDMEANGKVLNEEQLEKLAKEKEWMNEVEDVEHNLM